MTDNRFGKLYIRKRTFPQWLALYVLVMPFMLALLMEFLGVPGIIKYTIDAAWVSVLAVMLIQRHALLSKTAAPYVIFTLTFFLYVFVLYLFHFQSPFYFLWGYRNNFRLYVAFLAFAILFEEEDANGVLKLMDLLFWVNALFTFVQYFALGYEQDYLGGIFGTERGCNSFSIIFFGVVVSKSVLSFMNKQEKALHCLLKCGVSLIIAAFAELKLYFVIFLFILVMSAAITRFSWRKLLLLCLSAMLFAFASTLLTAVFGESNAITLERIWELATATTYSTAEDLGRFTAIPTISRTLFHNLGDRLFGFGLGNCETSAFAICNTPFYQTYSYLHYTWFSSAFLFLETGYVGLTLHLLFYGMSFFTAYRRLKRRQSNELFCQLGMIMSVLCVVLTFYNSSLRMEVGYVAYFALALPLIGRLEQTASAA